VSQSAQQQVPEGYKQTEFGVIPEDWEASTIGENTRWSSGGTPNRKRADYWEGSIPWISGSTLKTLEITTSDQFLTPEGVAAGSNMAPVNATLLLVRGSALHKYIRAGLVVSPVSFNQDVKSLMPYGSVLPRYLTLFVKGMENDLLKLVSSAGNSAGVLDTELVKNFKFLKPPMEEQTAIADALSDVDGLIGSLEKLIAKKRAIKTAAMQQLLTGKKRLPPFDQTHTGYKQTDLGEIPNDWEVVLFKELCASFKTGKLDANAMKPDGMYRFYTCAKNYSLIDVYAFDTEALLVSGNGANVGYVHYFKGKFNAYQRTYVLSDFDAVVGYLKLYLERKLADRIRVEVNSGNTPYITMDTLTDMEVIIPSSREEQESIAKVLSDIEQEIEALEQRLNKTQQLKQGMMQELLTGRTRLV